MNETSRYVFGIEVEDLLSAVNNMVDDSIVFSHLIELTSGRKSIEDTTNAITSDYRKIVTKIIKDYCKEKEKANGSSNQDT